MGLAGFKSSRAGCRRAALPCVLAVALLAPASAAEAQQLLTLVPGVSQAASAGDLGPSIGPVPTAVQVDLDLLRSAPARLEVPTPEGGVLSAQRSVFENRGGGDLMWSGGQPGAGYDTVVLTVEGGRLVGRFGAAGGGVYQIHAERDGRGGMAPLGGPVLEEWCGVEADAGDGHEGHAHLHAEALADPPERVSSPQGHDRLDILVAYTATAAENWAYLGGPVAAIRHAVDYMKMVFRNNRIEVEPHLVHIAQASSALDRAGRDLGRHIAPDRPLSLLMSLDGDLVRLQHEYRADFVHLFTGERAHLVTVCGSHSVAIENLEAQSKLVEFVSIRGWTTNHPLHCPDYAVTFVHEVGHGLGAKHDPPNASGSALRAYAFGHVDLDVMPAIGTAMSYRGQVEPFFSTPRIRPHGAILGIADERDNERMLQEFVHIGARYSDYLRSLQGVPAPPSDLRVRFDGDVARATWRDNAPDADGYGVYYEWPIGPGLGASRHLAAESRTGAVLPLEVTAPGTRYYFEVRATKGDVRSLRSNGVYANVPGDPIAAPSDVSVTVDKSLSYIEVQWTDNSDNESWFDVQLLQDGDPIYRERAPADSESTRIRAPYVSPEASAEYGARVFAFNSSGYSESSEITTFRWQHPRGPARVARVSAWPTGPTSVRVTWTTDPGTDVYRVFASLPFWFDQRVRERSQSGDAGTAWMDFENLARGGRYFFGVLPYEAALESVPSGIPLALGERDTGPRAPSEVAWVLEGDGVRLSWKDNSSDERGFEVQRSRGGGTIPGGTYWQRLLTVPADTETAYAHGLPASGRFRVFAYNDRGYSRGASASSGPCRADEVTLCLQDSRFQVTVKWWTADGVRGVGRVVEEGTDDSGLFQFLGPENWEILIKVLDGCGINGRMWVLGASTTDLGYGITVIDTIAQESRFYRNEPGQPAPAIVDTKAFSVACVDGAGP